MAALDEAKPQTAARPMLSALIVARNEEERLAACLERLRFADEIVVLLDRTTDRSAEIARGFGARIVEGAWEQEGERRAAGVAACRGEWIIEVDADEWVTPELAAEIRAVLPGAVESSFLIPIANHVGGRPIRFGWGAYNGASGRQALYRPGAKRWGKGRIHPPIMLSGARGRLVHPIDHFVDRDISDMFRRLNRYTDIAALDALDAGRVPQLWPSLRRIWSRGWKSYVARRGYREGAYGIALALFSALYPLLIYLKAATRADWYRPPKEGSR
jgi:glycosyltransferase involved in cell wall biosynthesis